MVGRKRTSASPPSVAPPPEPSPVDRYRRAVRQPLVSAWMLLIGLVIGSIILILIPVFPTVITLPGSSTTSASGVIVPGVVDLLPPSVRMLPIMQRGAAVLVAVPVVGWLTMTAIGWIRGETDHARRVHHVRRIPWTAVEVRLAKSDDSYTDEALTAWIGYLLRQHQPVHPYTPTVGFGWRWEQPTFPARLYVWTPDPSVVVASRMIVSPPLPVVIDRTVAPWWEPTSTFPWIGWMEMTWDGPSCIPWRDDPTAGSTLLNELIAAVRQGSQAVEVTWLIWVATPRTQLAELSRGADLARLPPSVADRMRKMEQKQQAAPLPIHSRLLLFIRGSSEAEVQEAATAIRRFLSSYRVSVDRITRSLVIGPPTCLTLPPDAAAPAAAEDDAAAAPAAAEDDAAAAPAAAEDDAAAAPDDPWMLRIPAWSAWSIGVPLLLVCVWGSLMLLTPLGLTMWRWVGWIGVLGMWYLWIAVHVVQCRRWEARIAARYPLFPPGPRPHLPPWIPQSPRQW